MKRISSFYVAALAALAWPAFAAGALADSPLKDMEHKGDPKGHASGEMAPPAAPIKPIEGVEPKKDATQRDLEHKGDYKGHAEGELRTGGSKPIEPVPDPVESRPTTATEKKVEKRKGDYRDPAAE